MKLLLQAIFFIFFAFNTQANENISKLNSLYLNGVLDKDTYFKSIEGLGIDTSNQIFINLFELFTSNVLDINSYENSINNLISVNNYSNTTNQEKKISSVNNDDLNFKTYVLDTCQGETSTCKDFSDLKVSFLISENSVKVDQSFFDLLLQNPEFSKINYVKTFTKNNDFDILTSINHISNFKVDFVFGGTMVNSDFEMTDFSFRGNGKEIIFAKLKLLN